MSVGYDQSSRVFHLRTQNSSYQMQADEAGVLLHLYYGEPVAGNMDYLIRYANRGFCGNPYSQRDNRGYSLDTLPQEYAGSGVGDYRLPAVQVIAGNGSRSVDLRYRDGIDSSTHEARRGREWGCGRGLPEATSPANLSCRHRHDYGRAPSQSLRPRKQGIDKDHCSVSLYSDVLPRRSDLNRRPRYCLASILSCYASPRHADP